MTEQEQERRIFRYSARYGQHPETEVQYREAIIACQNIGNLQLTVSEIARMYGLNPEGLRNQLKRHFPDVIPSRDKIREALGYSSPGNRGLKHATVNKYAAAINMLRDTQLTVREVATRCHVSYSGLQQHLLFFHKDIAESRMLYRMDALLKPVASGKLRGAPSFVGGIRGPKPETEAKFAPAVKLAKETQKPLTHIAKECGLNEHALASYLKKWYPDLVAHRRMLRETECEKKKTKRQSRPNRSAAAVARRRYTPAIELLVQGMTLSQAAKELDVDLCNLSAWFKRNYPEILEKTKAGMMTVPGVGRTLRKTYERFQPIAVYMNFHPSKSTQYVAEKYNVPVSSLTKYISKVFPDVWRRHCTACAKKAQRLKCRKEKTA